MLPAGRKVLSLALVILYGVFAYVYDQSLNDLWPYTTLLMEAVFVSLVAWVFRERWVLGAEWKARTFNRRTALAAPMTLLAGLFMYAFATWRGIVVPFEFSKVTTFVMLLLVAPVMEELVFRGALWELFAEFFGAPKAKVWLPLVATTAMFAFSHFYVIWWDLPPEIRTFVYYQTACVILLGWYLGLERRRTGNLIAPVIAHFSFNVGFVLGALIFAASS